MSRIRYLSLFSKTICNVVFDSPQQGNTPLHYASLRGNVNIVNLLVTKGASTVVKNKVSHLCHKASTPYKGNLSMKCFVIGT